MHRITAELADAERYQDAYYNIVDEVGKLVTRNALAEEEADKLSKFNAEILGHNNPAQKIMYVDRIRRELAETKQVRAVLRAILAVPNMTHVGIETGHVDQGPRSCHGWQRGTQA
jgi:hypothetical protein